MKLSSLITTGLLSLGLLATASADTSAPAPKFDLNQPAAAQPAAAPAAPAAKYTEAQICQAYGWLLGRQGHLPELEFSESQVAAIKEGLTLAAQGRPLGFETKDIDTDLSSFLGQKQQAFLNKVRLQNLSETAAYFTKLKAENKNLQALPDGLCIETIKAGTGAQPKQGQMVKFNYALSLIGGQVLQSTFQGGEPVEMLAAVGSAQEPHGVIAGMAEGLQKMNIGGRYKLHVPPQLAYGDEPPRGSPIPPSATLIFDIEVLDAKDAPKEAAPAAK